MSQNRTASEVDDDMTTLMSVNCIHVSGAIKMNHNYMGTANPSLEKEPTFCDPNGFSLKMTSEKQMQNFHTKDVLLPRSV